MKLSKWSAQDLSQKIEGMAKKLNETLMHIPHAHPGQVVEQLHEKASALLEQLRCTLVNNRLLSQPIPVTKTLVRKRVKENLDDAFQDEELIEMISENLYQAAKQDTRLSKAILNGLRSSGR